MAMRPYEMAPAVILRGTVRLADISGLRTSERDKLKASETALRRSLDEL